MPTDAPRTPEPDRVVRDRSGRRAEWAAIALLTVKGYRVLARRHRTPHGEIDLIARRGRRLAFVEVKYRTTDSEFDAALTAKQTARIHRAAEHYLAKNTRYAALDRHFDAVLVAPRRLPRHAPDALAPVGTSGRRY